MYILISAAIAMLAVFAVLYFGRRYDTDTKLGICLLVVLVSFALTVLVIFIIASAQSRRADYTSKTEICSMRNNNIVEGSFFLGSGSIKETQYYFYYVKSGNNSYSLSKMESIGTTITEDDNKIPGIYQDVTSIRFPEWSGFGPMIIERTAPCIVVPKGTIIKEFNLR